MFPKSINLLWTSQTTYCPSCNLTVTGNCHDFSGTVSMCRWHYDMRIQFWELQTNLIGYWMVGDLYLRTNSDLVDLWSDCGTLCHLVWSWCCCDLRAHSIFAAGYILAKSANTWMLVIIYYSYIIYSKACLYLCRYHLQWHLVFGVLLGHKKKSLRKS